METRQMTPFFYLLFCALTVCSIHFYIWKWSKFIFLWTPFGLFWSVKYINFEQKLPIRTAHHIFPKSRHPEVAKNPYCFAPKGSQNKVLANGLIPACIGVYIHYFKMNRTVSTVLSFLKTILTLTLKLAK